MLACSKHKLRQSFLSRAARHFGSLGQVCDWRSLRAGGLVACSHPESPSDKNLSKLAATLGDNTACDGFRSQKSIALLKSCPPPFLPL